MRMQTIRELVGVMAVLGGFAGGLCAAAEPAGPVTCILLPNGSFERWDRSMAKAPHINEEAFRQNPWAPKRWHLEAPGGTRWLQAEAARTGRYALRSCVPAKGDPAVARLRYVELVPGATYTFGAWVAGTGRVSVAVMGKALEGDQSIASATGEAGTAWQHIGGSFKAPAHLRLASLTLRAYAGDVRLDDAHLSAELDRPYDPDAVLNDKYGSDGDTLFLEDFDGPHPAIRLSSDRARITNEGEGRFGRGVRFDRVSTGTLPLALDAMPPEGTLEFWLRPDDASRQAVVLQFFPLLQSQRAGSLAWLWPCWGAPEKRPIHNFETDWQSWQLVTTSRMGSNQWFHSAITWDTNCVRTYVDGALVEMIVRPKLAWSGAPTHIQLSTPMDWCTYEGVIDEIRLSKTRRYGPVVPRGAVYTTPPMPIKMAPIAGDTNALSAKSPVMTTAEDRLSERKKLLGTVPDSQPGTFEAQPAPEGAYVYEAASAKPLVTGARCDLGKVGTGTNLQQVTLGNGLGRLPDEMVNQGCYWRVGAIEPGRYWINVLYHSGGPIEAPQREQIDVAVYLNGRIVQRSTHGDPVQIQPGLWLIEAQAATAEAINAGDEIAVVRAHSGGVVRVLLRKEPLPTGPYRMPVNFSGYQWNLYTALRVNAEAAFVDAGGRPLPPSPVRPGDYLVEVMAQRVDALLDTQGLARVVFTLVNPLPVPVTVDHDLTVTSYHREPGARDVGRLTLQPHEKVLRTVRFAWKPDEPAYTAEARLTAVKPPALSAPRAEGGLGWPEHETYTFFPGHRQTLPWPDPFKDRVIRRAVLAAARVDGRDTLQLDAPGHAGAWQRAFTTALEPPMPPPAGLAFEPAAVPMHWGWTRIAEMKPRPHGAYVRRTFTLPADLGDRSYRLTLTEATDEATAYVNGVRVGNVRGGSTPLICDITRAVRPGTNELTLVVRDLIAIMNPAYVNTNAPVPNLRYLDAPGLFSDQSLGLGSVSIEAAPSVTVEDAFAIPSVRKGQMAARLTVANRRKAPVEVRVRATVLDAGKPVLEIGERTLRLEPDRPAEVRLERAWKNPRMWGPDDSHLYVLAMETTDAATGARLDYRRERFGFREVWIDGPHIRFNGEPISPIGAGMMTRLFENVGHRIGRFPVMGCPDYADEAGIPSGANIHELRNTPSQHNVDRDAFWQAAESNCLASARLQQNHPSIVMWEMSNEWLCYSDYDANDPLAGCRRFKRLSDAVRAVDPTRFTHFSADGDLGGLLDNHSFHYMNPCFDTTGFGLRGHAAYFPDQAFWRPLDRHLQPGETVSLSPHHKVPLRPSAKVIMDTECLWKAGEEMWPPGLSRVAGEEDVLSTAMDEASGPIVWMWKTLLDGLRDLGVAPLSPITYLTSVQRGAYLPRALIMPENQRRAFGGRTETRRYTLINGLFRPADMTLRWTLRGPDGKTLAKGKDARRFAEEKIQRGELSFKLPDVKARTVCTLAATLESDGAFLCGEEWDIEVYPDAPVLAGSLARRVVLFEPEAGVSVQGSGVREKGRTAHCLTAMGVACEATSQFPETRNLTPETCLLILGEDVLTTTNVVATAGLGAFVEAGGRVLVLRQGVAPAGLPVATQLEPRHWASQVFVRMGSHPVMQGLDDMDLHFWQPDRTVALGAYTKPSLGTAISLADSGAVGGMERVHLMEVYRGRGLYLLCQMPVVARYDGEPMARELLARMVRYAAGTDAFCQPTNTLTVVAAAGSPVVKRLEEVGANVKVDGGGWKVEGKGRAVLGDAASMRVMSPANRVDLAASLRGGATVVVIGATPADTNWLSELAGSPVRLTVQPYSMWEGRGWRRGWPRLTAGLSLLDLYWKRYYSDAQANGQIEDPKRSIEPLQEFAVQVATGTELVFPGALVEVPVGQGRLVLDQRRWTTSHKELRRLADRQLSALLTGLNVAIVPPPPPRELPREVAYRTIDLTPYANRSLVDDVAEDGKGSWNDQGTACDLRALPTGRQNFQGIPFLIGEGPLNCILLANPRKGGDTLPREVALPLGYAIEGLCFLHTSAWTDGDGTEIATYSVEYADGAAVTVPLRGGVSLYDWIGPKPFLAETGTRSVTAWTGSCDRFPVVAVYRMLWVNPRPEAVVQRVVYARPTLTSLPVLIGVTAVVDKKAVAVSAEAAAKAVALFAQGRDAAGKGDLPAARTALKQALELDPAQPEAYRLLADVCERKGDEDWLLDAYGLWMRSGPRSPLPWNRTGEILEKRRNLQGALEAYKKSLEIEWNQPPIMDARKRLEAEIK